jgi:hypothetical protein
MTRNRWRVLRAMRVVLACLVLWLPARAGSASFAPADAVVMIAGVRGAGGVNATNDAGARAQNGRGARVVLGTANTHFFASSTRLAPPPPSDDAHRARETRTVPRTVAAPLFLKHCALLR